MAPTPENTSNGDSDGWYHPKCATIRYNKCWFPNEFNRKSSTKDDVPKPSFQDPQCLFLETLAVPVRWWKVQVRRKPCHLSCIKPLQNYLGNKTNYQPHFLTGDNQICSKHFFNSMTGTHITSNLNDRQCPIFSRSFPVVFQAPDNLVVSPLAGPHEACHTRRPPKNGGTYGETCDIHHTKLTCHPFKIWLRIYVT